MPLKPEAANYQAFTRDVASNAGYLYTSNARLSSYLANRRLTDATLAIANICGKKVIDIGCGDGTFTIELYDRGNPASILGCEPVESAVEVARQKIAGRKVTFAAHSAYKLPFAADSFDIAHIRGVLHHMDRPQEAIREALRVASALVVLEPNGYNPGLKLLERFSKYHIEHGEKSYPPRKLDQWTSETGGVITFRQWVGIVPFFCPDWLAKTMRFCESPVEKLPLINKLSCAVYIFYAERSAGK